ncbi:hypothetical protein GGF32_008765 [Allomyces javanicus]|nr:hypothetical protein GGF32_008765 [Allomyces javanicus]
MTGSTSDSVGQPTYASMRRAQQNTFVSLSRNANAIGYMSPPRGGAPAPVVVPATNSANHGGPVQTYVIAPQPGVVTTLLPAVTTLSRPAVESRAPTLRERVAHGAQRHRTAIGVVLGLLVAGLLFLVMAVTMDIFSLDKFSVKSHGSLQSARDSSATTTRPDPMHASGSAHGHGAHPLHINFSPIVTVDRITVTSAGGLTVSTTSMPPTMSPGSSRAPSVSDVQLSDMQRSDTDPPEPLPALAAVPAAASPSPGPGPPPQETYTFQLSVPGGLSVAGGAAAAGAGGMPSSLSIQISPASVTDLSSRPPPPSAIAADLSTGSPGPVRGDAAPARTASPPPVAAHTFTADPDPLDDGELNDVIHDTAAAPPPPAAHHPRRHQIRRSASAALADAPAPSSPSSSSRSARAPHRHRHHHDAASPPAPRLVGLTKSESTRVMPTGRHPSPTDPLTASPRASRKHGHHGPTKLALLRERVIEDIVQYKSHVDLDEASNDALPAVTGAADVGSPPGPGGSRRLRTATSAAYMAARPAVRGEAAHGGAGASARMPRSASLAGMSASHRASKADQWWPVGGVAAGSAGGRVGEVIREQAYYEASMEIQKWVTSTDHVLV